ncbi:MULTISPECIES: flagellar motor switch protein FliM [Halomonas]|uniref:Flagellar motor switch protein FliM n=4 Tax=Pseudomonadota TaxID=1224 RepID=A0AAU7KGW8_9GAMM|nr:MULTISPECIES: flagellar motor switch protein FliM [Halomonas]MBR9772485.1 flagellar motor switch protein FliM [Gammaproteobacteria bacterium]KJZ16469.1 flagellar motor switch protein FliM [Halomonas sp. S2151]MAR74076.1 flagellar motor switch protein FliM [Halomonas sp.]MBR9880288.1 flagellar motor switch protein FliM [Gammaproteobacteria bacterium]MBS8270383.1 flagellar motor switch protein FliM [Halomonas litopenaei]
MSQDDLLSQEEIDALLKGVSGDDDAEGEDNAARGRLRPFDPANQQRIIRERLQALDIINERFARHFRTGMFNLLRRSADISVDAVRYLSYSEFSRNVPVPTNINIIAMKPLKGSALIVFPPSLVFMVVDNLFGGDGRFVTKSEGREFTNTEQRIIQRVLNMAIDGYSEAWKSVYPLDISYLRSEMQSKFANITNSPNEIVVSTSFHLEVGNLSSSFQICMPYSMIEPLKDLLTNPLSENSRDKDGAFHRRMAGELRHPEVELVANFATIDSRIAEVMALKVGDILPLELPDTVTAQVDEVPVMECEYGSQRDQRALRVLRMFDHAAGHQPSNAFVKGSRPPSKESHHD